LTVFSTGTYLYQRISTDSKDTLVKTRVCGIEANRNKNRNKFINQIRAPGGHIQLTIMIDTQQQYIKLNIHSEVSIIVVHIDLLILNKNHSFGPVPIC
jgi:hypothetical protein